MSGWVADEYAAAGFGVVVQDNIYGSDVARWMDRVRARPRHLVVLRPSIGVVAARDEQRRRSTGKIAYHGGLQTPEQTVAEALSRSSEARLP